VGREVDIVVPIKRLDRAKSRLRGAASDHDELVLALLLDTVTAACRTPGVRRVLVVCEDKRVPAALRTIAMAGLAGVDCVDERGLPGLNAALEFGASVLRRRHRRNVVAALQADLPALRPGELAEALAEAGGRRAFCADHAGIGTTLLLSAPGGPLEPRFGAGSAAAHAAGGAAPIAAALPSLRCDVDTPADLSAATSLGLGAHTARLLATGSAVR
jgi:2-phospho-L-lactate/phosphoenolpyruvate guanylyltransferase